MLKDFPVELRNIVDAIFAAECNIDLEPLDYPKYKYSDTLQGIINKSKIKYSFFVGSEIARDEAIAQYYYSLLKIGATLPIEEVNIDNKDYISTVVAYAHLKIKNSLVPASFTKKDKLLLLNFSNLNDMELDQVESIEYNPTKYNDLSNDISQWFQDNKEEVLTKKQLKYIDNEIPHIHRNTLTKIKSNIKKEYEIFEKNQKK